MTAVIPSDKFNIAPLNEIPVPEDFNSALEFFGGSVLNASEVIVDDFPAIDKGKLVNVPFLLLGWTLSRPEDSNNGQYIVARGITQAGKRFRFADGSTGIFKQLVQITQTRIQNGEQYPNAGLYCESGLRKSDYTFVDEKGQTQDATTFYINNEV